MSTHELLEVARPDADVSRHLRLEGRITIGEPVKSIVENVFEHWIAGLELS